jgi:hypothetical protein
VCSQLWSHRASVIASQEDRFISCKTNELAVGAANNILGILGCWGFLVPVFQDSGGCDVRHCSEANDMDNSNFEVDLLYAAVKYNEQVSLKHLV